jgi:hypothetical protein
MIHWLWRRGTCFDQAHEPLEKETPKAWPAPVRALYHPADESDANEPQGEEHPCNRDRRARSGRGSGLHRVPRVPDEKQHHHQQQQISHRSSSLPSILQSERSSPGSLAPTLVRASRAVLIKETRIVSKARGNQRVAKAMVPFWVAPDGLRLYRTRASNRMV